MINKLSRSVLFVFCMFCLNTLQAQVTKILFLGNSYTYVNNLPQTLADLALSMGDTITFDSNAPGGYTLNGHSTNATSLAKIKSQKWNYVVLQEQSQLPSFDPIQVATDVYPYAAILNDSILANDSCTETIFYMTWGRKNGDASNCASYPPVCTYGGMQQRLRESYMQMAADNHATVAPIGVAWQNFRSTFPTVELYQSDESHPVITGTYLNACVFYASIFHKSPVGATYPVGISATDASNIQLIAAATVLDSIALWQDAGDIPNVNFSFDGNNQFTSTSINANSYYWNFGDGNFSTLENPQHTYSNNGNYNVTLTVSNNCRLASYTSGVQFNSVGLKNILEQNNFVIYPNPANESLNIKFIERNPEQIIVRIVDVLGKEVQVENYNSNNKEISISTENLSNGIYFIQVNNSQNKKIIINK